MTETVTEKRARWGIEKLREEGYVPWADALDEVIQTLQRAERAESELGYWRGRAEFYRNVLARVRELRDAWATEAGNHGTQPVTEERASVLEGVVSDLDWALSGEEDAMTCCKNALPHLHREDGSIRFISEELPGMWEDADLHGGWADTEGSR